MKNVLWYSDFLCPTGFGNVAENIVERLQHSFRFEAIGINHKGNAYNKPDNPYYKFKNIPVSPAMDGGDMFGKAKLNKALDGGKKGCPFDTLFILQDLFNLVDVSEMIANLKLRQDFRFVLYFPIDGPVYKEWKQIIRIADQAVAYTHWANTQLDMNLPVIYHGVDKCYKPLKPEEIKQCRNEYFGIPDDAILVTNVNRNQPRKDLTKTIAAFNIFQQIHPNAVLYLHCDWKDNAGIDMMKFIEYFYPHLLRKIIQPRGMLSKEGMNAIYNASDMLVSSTLGEGWGLSTVEAMATNTPVVIPNNTTAQEIVGEDRGYICESGNTPSLWTSLNFDNNLIRPTVDVEDMAKKMCYLIDNKKETFEKVKNAKEWVTENCDWDKVALQWKELL